MSFYYVLIGPRSICRHTSSPYCWSRKWIPVTPPPCYYFTSQGRSICRWWATPYTKHAYWHEQGGIHTSIRVGSRYLYCEILIVCLFFLASVTEDWKVSTISQGTLVWYSGGPDSSSVLAVSCTAWCQWISSSLKIHAFQGSTLCLCV